MKKGKNMTFARLIEYNTKAKFNGTIKQNDDILPEPINNASKVLKALIDNPKGISNKEIINLTKIANVNNIMTKISKNIILDKLPSTGIGASGRPYKFYNYVISNLDKAKKYYEEINA